MDYGPSDSSILIRSHTGIFHRGYSDGAFCAKNTAPNISKEFLRDGALNLIPTAIRLILIVRNSFFRRSRAKTLNSRTAQERALHDKYKSNWCRGQVEGFIPQKFLRNFWSPFFRAKWCLILVAV